MEANQMKWMVFGGPVGKLDVLRVVCGKCDPSLLP
jgi:hypothetical protein